jgi:hypothetical protein
MWISRKNDDMAGKVDNMTLWIYEAPFKEKCMEKSFQLKRNNDVNNTVTTSFWR